MTKAEWLALPWRVRAWRVLFCSHPFEESTKLAAVHIPSRDVASDFAYMANVRECGRCSKLFLDAGHEFKDRSWVKTQPCDAESCETGCALPGDCLGKIPTGMPCADEGCDFYGVPGTCTPVGRGCRFVPRYPGVNSIER